MSQRGFDLRQAGRRRGVIIDEIHDALRDFQRDYKTLPREDLVIFVSPAAQDEIARNTDWGRFMFQFRIDAEGKTLFGLPLICTLDIDRFGISFMPRKHDEEGGAE
jgi:hypothetical protein